MLNFHQSDFKGVIQEMTVKMFGEVYCQICGGKFSFSATCPF